MCEEEFGIKQHASRLERVRIRMTPPRCVCMLLLHEYLYMYAYMYQLERQWLVDFQEALTDILYRPQVDLELVQLGIRRRRRANNLR